MSSMKLPLCRQGDHNGNAFPVSSSSSSSSSPESLRSLSGLTGDRTESPLEYDLLAVTMTTAVIPAQLEEVVLSRWAPEEEVEEEDEEGRFQTDASASLYLDAISAGFQQDTWSPRLDSYQGNGSSSAADSDTTEIPADEEDEDEEDEALFVSVSSDMCVTLSQVSPAGAGAGLDLQDEGSDPVRAAELPRGDLDDLDGPAASQNLSRTSQTSSDPVGGTAPPQEVHLSQTGLSGAARISSQETKGTQNPCPSRTPAQNRPEPCRRAEVVGSRRLTPGLPGPVKVARLLRPSRGKGASTRADHQGTAASPSAPPEKKKAAESRAASSSSVGFDPVREAATQTAQEKLRTPSKRAASRPQGRSGRPDRGPGPDSAGAEADGPAARNQNQAIPKPRASGVAHSPTASIPKPSSNQQSAPGSAWRPPAPAASKLPVKGVPAGLSSSSLGSSENNVASSKAPSPAGSKPDEPPSRGSSSTSAPSAPSDGSSCSAPKPPAVAMRGRAPSLQARATTGLKSPTGTNQNSIRTPGSQLVAKAAPSGSAKPPLQRNGSTRLSRLNSTVDKNKPATRPATGGSQITTGNQQNQQNLPAEPAPDVLNANSPGTPALPVPTPDGSSSTSGSAAPTGPGLKARTGSRSSPKHGPRPQHASRPGAAPAKPNQNKEQVERKNQAIVQLRRLLVQGNRKVEALAAVIQHLFSEREDTLKKKKDLLSELEKLRADLVASAQRCQSLQEEREEVRSNLEEALRRAEEQHQEELVHLENRLKSFYQAEWDKVHQLYQEEADKCRLLMEQQVEELRSRQEVERRKQEESHSQKMEAVKQEYDTSIQELRRVQVTELEDLQKTLKETETSLAEKISLLSAENEDLSEKLRAEEERRQRILSDKSLKDSHTLYLEQELDSLKVVLEIKNQQLHQKEKKLMEMDKLVETNVRLEECLKKVQQENEDYKARMDKHAALSKQLSTEQAILQQTLQKESKVNKRLSMENEELLWKLHNGDLLGSPRRLTPPSPCGSPRDSAHFPTAAPVSPR